MNNNSKKFILNDFFVNLGNSIFTLVIMWYVYDLTQSAFYTSLIGSLSHIINITFGIYLGILSDKINQPKKLMVYSLLLNSIVLLIIILVDSQYGHINIYLLIILVAIRETIFVFQYPNQTKLIPIISSQDKVKKLIGFRSISKNISSILGYGLAGLIFTLISFYQVITINFLTFLIGLILISSIRLETPEIRKNNSKNRISLNDFRNTLSYIYKDPYLFRVLYLTCALNIVSMVAPTFVVYFQEYLNSNSTEYGYFQGLIATGSILAATVFIKLKGKFSSFYITVISWILMGFTMICLYLSKYIYISIFIGLIVGICLTLPNILFSTYKILIIEDEYRGRVSSTLKSIGVVFIPLSYFFAAYISDYFGPEYVFLVAGIFQLIVAVTFIFDKYTRNKYDQLV